MNLYISDIDGTLINGDKMLSPFSRDNLTAMLKSGLPFTIASARSIVTLREILGDLPFQLPVIESNGAFITDWATGRHLATHAMKAEVADSVWSILRQNNTNPIIVTNCGLNDHIYCPPAHNPGMAEYYEEREAAGDNRMISCEIDALPLDEQIVMFVVIEHYDKLAELEKQLSQHHGSNIHMHLMENLYYRDWHWLTVHDPQATKGHAVKVLKERFVPSASCVIVFGDHTNDISLFESADHRVAVANATDELKRHAHEIIGPHTDDAVVKFLMSQWPISQMENLS